MHLMSVSQLVGVVLLPWLLGNFQIAAAKSQQYTYTLIKHGAGCPTPIPTASLLNLTVSRTTTKGETQPTAFTHSDGSVIPQVVFPDQNKNPITLQTSNSSRVVIVLPNGQSAVVDDTGVLLYPSNCNSTLHLPIPGLVDVLNQASGASSRLRTKRVAAGEQDDEEADLLPRATKSLTLPITVSLVDQCKNPITGHAAYAQCNVIFGMGVTWSGSDKTYPLKAAGAAGTYSGSCSYPDLSSAQDKCSKKMKDVLEWPTKGIAGQMTYAQGDLAVLQRFIRKSVAADIAAAAMAFFNLPDIAFGLGALGMYQQWVVADPDGPKKLAGVLCSDVNVGEIIVADRLDTETDFVPESNQVGGPYTAVTATRTVSLASVTTCSPTATCTQAGYCNNYSECSAGSGCYCAGDVSGKKICIADFLCDTAPGCTTNLDCAKGYSCLSSNSCCGTPKCVPTSACKQKATRKMARDHRKHGLWLY